MKKMLSFVVILLILGVSSAFAQTVDPVTDKPYYGYEKVSIQGKAWVAPDYINLEAFPPLGGKLSERDARILQLHREPLKTEGWYVNEVRGRRTFEVIWLDKGEMVWVSNASGEPRYLASCGNRISFLLAHRITTHATPAPENTSNSTAAIASESNDGYSIPGWLRSLWRGLRNLFLFLLALALAALLLALAFLLGRELYENLTGRRGGVRPQGVPVRPRHFGPRPVAPGAVPAPPPPPDATFHRFGPFDHIAIDDAGAAGYRVTGYNGDVEVPLGTYRWAETENAGDRGEYVVVMV